jgi:FAD/FMN-containing dehydrogenase
VTASNTTNSDLFWAIRGAGASFGIIVNYKFQTFPAPATVVVYSYGLSFGSFAAAQTTHAALQAYANSSTMPSELNMRAFITSFGASLQGTYYGNVTTFQTLIQPVLAFLSAGSAYASVQTQDWITSLETYAYGSLITPIDYDNHETFVCSPSVSGPKTDK